MGDSEMAGRSDPAGLAAVYPGYPDAGLDLRMVRTGGAWVPLAEPCADGAWPPVGVGPAGMFGQLRALATGVPTCIVNGAIGGLKSSEWLPSSNPASPYQLCLMRAMAAITYPGAVLGGFLLYDGANDATEAVCSWAANWDVTLPSLQSWIGEAPIIYTRLPATVPTDLSYPTWATVRSQQAAWASARRIMVQAPEGPWREPYLLHLDIAGSYVVSERMRDAAVP